jgi:hypothetical protein
MGIQSLDRQLAAVAAMDQQQVITAIKSLDCGFPVDFTDEYLRSLELEKLRHLYLALMLQCRRQTGPVTG